MKKHDMRTQLVQLGNGAHALATQILGNADDAADAVQDAYAKALTMPDAYQAELGAFTPWFLRVVRNRCIDLVRRRRPATNEVDQIADVSPGPEMLLAHEQRDLELQAALAELSSEQRQIIVLRDYMDLSYAEIAGVLDIAQGTVMSRLHRARLALKEELIRHG